MKERDLLRLFRENAGDSEIKEYGRKEEPSEDSPEDKENKPEENESEEEESEDKGSESDELTMGIEVEKEHKGTYEKFKGNPNMSEEDFYKSIAEDHLKEFSNYYTLLKEMEAGAKDSGSEESEEGSEGEEGDEGSIKGKVSIGVIPMGNPLPFGGM